MSDTSCVGFHSSSRPRAKARAAEEMEDFEMSVSLERYYGALLTRGQTDNLTIDDARRDLQRDWIQLAVRGGAVRF